MAPHLENESSLIAAARAGDKAAFMALANHYADRIYHLAFQIAERPQDAEDILQESLLKAFAHIGDFRAESRFYTWLVRIALNEALATVRRRGDRRFVWLDEPIGDDEQGWMPRELEAWEDDPEKRYGKEELNKILAEAIAGLPPPLRTVFLLRDVEELSTEETATTLGLSPAASKSRLHRARLQIREQLSVHFQRPAAALGAAERSQA